MKLVLLDRLEAIRPFSEAEAWGLYRIAALNEAVGWTLLIIGVAIRHFKWPGHAYAVPIAGQIHGTIFLIYFGVLLATYTSLRWSRGKFVFAALAGVPPYGSLLFEQWAAYQRRTKLSRRHTRTIVLAILNQRLSLLV